MIENAKTRYEYMDILKILFLIMVITGHSNAPHNIIVAVNSIHMVGFYMISGYFFKEKGIKKQIVSSARSLLPYAYITILAGNIIRLTRHFLFGYELSFSTTFWRTLENKFDGVTFSGCGAVWYLIALFISKVGLEIMLKTKYPIIPVLLFCALAHYTVKVYWLPLYIQPGLGNIFFLYTGYLLKKYDVLNRPQLGHSLLIGFGLIFLWNFVQAQLNVMVVANCDYTFTDIFTGIMGVLGFMLFFKNLPMPRRRLDKRIYSIVLYCGQNTLAIICWHKIDMHLLPWIELVT